MSVSKDLVDIIKSSDDKGTKAYDTSATVTRVDGSTVWVHIPGGVDETPVKRTINASAGDVVQVRVSGGSAWLNGNASAPPTDDSQANVAVEYALVANNAADSAVKSAKEAKEAADSVHDIAVQAQSDATIAKDAADNASEYAARALGNLSTVQSVTETLNWIAQHGTMALTTDVALDPTHVYFVVDAGGDYVVGGVTYAVVTEPDVADIGTYYELSIDESLNNYVGTHLALTSEGLWLLPAASGTNKVLIAHGNGSVYTTAGTYIIDDIGNTVAMFGENATIGIDDGTQSYLYEDYHSLQLIDKEGNTYFYASDLRDGNGEYVLTNTFTGDGSTTSWEISMPPDTLDVYVNNVLQTLNTDYTFNSSLLRIIFQTAPANGATIKAVTTSTNYRAKAYTLGLRSAGSDIGSLSVAEGYDNLASGFCAHVEGESNTVISMHSHAEGNGNSVSAIASHAEGYYNEVSARFSHAEGSQTEAKGYSSHTQNEGTIAQGMQQTVLGRWNTPQGLPYNSMATDLALIIGNGTSNNSRSNALEMNWRGDVFLALNTNSSPGTTDGDLYAAITALGWQNDVIV